MAGDWGMLDGRTIRVACAAALVTSACSRSDLFWQDDWEPIPDEPGTGGVLTGGTGGRLLGGGTGGWLLSGGTGGVLTGGTGGVLGGGAGGVLTGGTGGVLTGGTGGVLTGGTGGVLTGGTGGAVPACGDGRLDPGEACDDGNAVDGDGCSANCLSNEKCGNAIVDTATGEACDDGDTTGGDGCSADCLSDETCGNAILDAAVGEQCDDGNTVDGDGCSATCWAELCGDGVLQPGLGEQCDDGNAVDGDGCSALCVVEFTCGNGLVESLEVCDDGNLVGGDGCSADCLSNETCGNAVVDDVVGEQCDDGNTVDGDGCSSACVLDSTRTVIVDVIPGYRGWWDGAGAHSSTNDNTLTGWCCGPDHPHNSYFVFDLGSITGVVVAVELRLYVDDYSSSDLSETLAVSDVLTDPAVVEASGWNDTAVYDDLGQGARYADLLVGPADVGTVVAVPFSAAGVQDVQAALGRRFAIGFSLTTPRHVETEWVRFSFDDETVTQQLVLTLAP